MKDLIGGLKHSQFQHVSTILVCRMIKLAHMFDLKPSTGTFFLTGQAQSQGEV